MVIDPVAKRITKEELAIIMERITTQSVWFNMVFKKSSSKSNNNGSKKN
nr:109_t:CDS:2 [Entrophospora candida]